MLLTEHDLEFLKVKKKKKQKHKTKDSQDVTLVMAPLVEENEHRRLEDSRRLHVVTIYGVSIIKKKNSYVSGWG